MTLDQLNQLPADEARAVLLSCCGSRRWVQELEQRRPFASLPELLSEAADIEQDMTAADWLEAFAAHPRIGERSASSWSQAEQAAALSAGADVQSRLLAANRAYEEKFGFIFIVFASDKTPEQVLALMAERMSNSREQEIHNAAAQQHMITRHRLRKLLNV